MTGGNPVARSSPPLPLIQPQSPISDRAARPHRIEPVDGEVSGRDELLILQVRPGDDIDRHRGGLPGAGRDAPGFEPSRLVAGRSIGLGADPTGFGASRG